jgi:hypothetical protein
LIRKYFFSLQKFKPPADYNLRLAAKLFIFATTAIMIRGKPGRPCVIARRMIRRISTLPLRTGGSENIHRFT